MTDGQDHPADDLGDRRDDPSSIVRILKMVGRQSERRLSMDLFHLTTVDEYVIDAIAQEGLKPGPNSWRGWSPDIDRGDQEGLQPGPNSWRGGSTFHGELFGDVVWLTDDPTIKHWQGILFEPDTGDTSVSLWRVVCAIPAQDPRLLRFRNLFHKSAKLSRFCKSIWLYGGLVPPRRIKDIEFLGTRRYWEKHST